VSRHTNADLQPTNRVGGEATTPLAPGQIPRPR
jgi:hypothetical protein